MSKEISKEKEKKDFKAQRQYTDNAAKATDVLKDIIESIIEEPIPGNTGMIEAGRWKVLYTANYIFQLYREDLKKALKNKKLSYIEIEKFNNEEIQKKFPKETINETKKKRKYTKKIQDKKLIVEDLTVEEHLTSLKNTNYTTNINEEKTSSPMNNPIYQDEFTKVSLSLDDLLFVGLHQEYSLIGNDNMDEEELLGEEKNKKRKLDIFDIDPKTNRPNGSGSLSNDKESDQTLQEYLSENFMATVKYSEEEGKFKKIDNGYTNKKKLETKIQFVNLGDRNLNIMITENFEKKFCEIIEMKVGKEVSDEIYFDSTKLDDDFNCFGFIVFDDEKKEIFLTKIDLKY
jgi:hypothetical protein